MVGRLLKMSPVMMSDCLDMGETLWGAGMEIHADMISMIRYNGAFEEFSFKFIIAHG